MSKSFKKRYEDEYDDIVYDSDEEDWKRKLREKRKRKQVEQTSWMKPEDEEIKQ